MSKVRVYDLAKEYGMKGPQLVQMLKELGFEKVKSHMSVLDPATELHARAVIQAQGVEPAAADTAVGVDDGTETEADPGIPRKKSLPSARATEPAADRHAPRKKTLPSAAPTPPLRVQPETAASAEAEATELEPPAPTPKRPAREARDEPAAAVADPVAPPPQSAQAATPEPVAPPAPPIPEPVETAPVQPAAPEPIVESPAAEAPRPAARRAPVAETPAPAEAATPPAPDDSNVKKLLVPEARAKVVGRIELPQEAISDAKRRSAPGSGRNPGGVNRDLRRAALRNTQSRSASRAGPRSGAPSGRRGPGVGGGRRGPAGRSSRRGGTSGSGGLTSTVDPNKPVEMQPPISVKGLSEALGIKVTDLIAALTFKLGVAGKNINSFLTNDEVELVALEVGRIIKVVERREAEDELIQDLVRAAEDVDEIVRPPIVTFMGHVDHGKTSLLDALRDSDVAKREAGGITQHVGAYRILWNDDTEFVVLDTPGHEAFTAMRARGAKLTDIVVLVVAADDGVMPQTEEAIAHARDAKVPIIVAINKCDRADANPMQVMQQLAVKGLQPEEWGGEVQVVQVSALKRTGLDELVEQIMLQAEILELVAKPTVAGEGIVIESKQTPEQGVVLNVMVTNGTLRLRDQVLCGESLSRIRGMIDDHGESLEEAGPATPVALLGITSLPMPGDKLYVVNDKKKAREVVEDRQRLARNLSLAERSKVTLENLSATLEASKVKEIKVIVKADVMGSLEPIRESLRKLDTDEVRINIVHSALGGISETDVSLAAASGAVILGFNSAADVAARQAAERADVDIRHYSVIYELLDEVKKAMEGMLTPDEVEEIKGHAEIRAVFRSSKFGNIAGCFVLDGSITRNSKVRLSRDGRVVYTGSLASLRREKDDVREVKGGYECGMTLKDFNDIKEGDQLEFYELKLVKRRLG